MDARGGGQLPDYIKGVSCVLSASTYSYTINGAQVMFPIITQDVNRMQ